LVKKLTNEVLKASNESQKALKDGVAAVKKCGGKKVKESSWPEAPKPRKTFKEVQKKHKKCDLQKGLYKTLADTCKEELAGKKRSFKVRCVDLKTLPKDISTCVFNDAVDQPALFYKQMAEYWSTKYSNILALKKECANLTQEIKDYRENTCGVHNQKLANQTKDCNDQYEQLRLAACAWKQGLSQECQTYSGCRDQAVTSYKLLENTTRQAVKGWKLQWRMVKRLDCLVGAFDFKASKVDKKKLDACSKAGRYPTDHLDLVFPSLPGAQICNSKLPGDVSTTLTSTCGG